MITETSDAAINTTIAATPQSRQADQAKSQSAWPDALQSAAQITDRSTIATAGTPSHPKVEKSPVSTNASSSGLLALVNAVNPQRQKIILARPNEIPASKKNEPPAAMTFSNFLPSVPIPDTTLIITKKHNTEAENKVKKTIKTTMMADSVPPSSLTPQLLPTQAAMPGLSDPAAANNLKPTVPDVGHGSETSVVPSAMRTSVSLPAKTVEFFVHENIKATGTKIQSVGLQYLASSVAAGNGQPVVSSPSPASPPSAAQTSLPISIPVNAAGLAAAITALHQSGESSAVIRLSPPGLGDLSVHVSMGLNAQVNVLLVSAIPQTVQLLHNNLDDLRQAMVASGLSLGEANVGNGSNQNNFAQSAPQGRISDVAWTNNVTTALATSTGIRAVA